MKLRTVDEMFHFSDSYCILDDRIFTQQWILKAVYIDAMGDVKRARK